MSVPVINHTIPRQEVVDLIAALLGTDSRLVMKGIRSVHIGPEAVTVEWAGRSGLCSIILIGD